MSPRIRAAFPLVCLAFLGLGCAAPAPDAPTAAMPDSPDKAPTIVPTAHASEAVPTISFPLLAEATRFINENQGKKSGEPGYETVMDLVVKDPVAADTYWFATSSYDQAKGQDFVGVYSFKDVTYNWWRAYKAVFKRGDDGSPPAELHVIAKDGSTLYLVADPAGSSHDGKTPAADKGGIYSLDLGKPLEGLKQVTQVPTWVAQVKL